MKPVIVLSSNKNSKEALRKALLVKKYSVPVLVRMDDSYCADASKYKVIINPSPSVSRALNKVAMKEILYEAGVKILPSVRGSDSLSFPLVFKKNTRNKDGRPSVYYVEDKNEMTFIAQLCGKGYYVESFIKFTSEYRLFCTKEDVFLIIKKIRQDDENPILNKNNSTNIRILEGGSIKLPKLWTNIKKNALLAMAALNLDIASIDVGYCSSGDHHSFCIHKVNPCPALPPNVLNAYIEKIDQLIKQKI